MIQIKLLEILDRKEAWALDCYPEFVKALNTVLGYNVETIYKPDESFDGYYLMPIGGAMYLSEKYKKWITNKSFLLGVFNADIPDYIEKFNPAGLTNWSLFNRFGTSVIGKTEVIEKVYTLEEGDNIMYENLGYDQYIPILKDGTYETVAKSILSYLEVYDNHLKNK